MPNPYNRHTPFKVEELQNNIASLQAELAEAKHRLAVAEKMVSIALTKAFMEGVIILSDDIRKQAEQEVKK